MVDSMKLIYNARGTEKKRLVSVVAEYEGVAPTYLATPSFAYRIGRFLVDREGNVNGTEEALEALEEVLKAEGFNQISLPEAAEEAEETEQTEEVGAEEAEAEETEQTEQTEDPEEDGLTLSLPSPGADALGRIRKMVVAKGDLIRKALATDRLDIEEEEGEDGDKVLFPWWDTLPSAEEVGAYSTFIAALCRFAAEAKRVTATPKKVDSEKFAFRCLLLRLGFVGEESKPQRRLLMQRLSGSAAFPTAEKAEEFKKRRKAEAAEEAEAEEVAACE